MAEESSSAFGRQRSATRPPGRDANTRSGVGRAGNTPLEKSRGMSRLSEAFEGFLHEVREFLVVDCLHARCRSAALDARHVPKVVAALLDAPRARLDEA